MPGGASDRNLEHLVEMGIEPLAQRIDSVNVAALEHLHQLAMVKIDAGQQVARRLVGFFAASRACLSARAMLSATLNRSRAKLLAA